MCMQVPADTSRRQQIFWNLSAALDVGAGEMSLGPLEGRQSLKPLDISEVTDFNLKKKWIFFPLQYIFIFLLADPTK